MTRCRDDYLNYFVSLGLKFNMCFLLISWMTDTAFSFIDFKLSINF